MDTPASYGSKGYIYDLTHSDRRKPWRATPWRRLPWLGFGALFGALLGVVASIAILLESNGQATDTWTLQPTVYLAVASAIPNIALQFALSEGAKIAWWRRAMAETTKVADLHSHWSYADSLWAALRSGRHVNMIAIACIMVAIGPINGPLLQRASFVSVGHFEREVELNVMVAQTLPDGYTGYLSGRGQTPALLTPAFSGVVNAASSQADINIASTGCTGKCVTTVRGAGFAIKCSGSTVPFSLTPKVDSDGSGYNADQEATADGTQAFGTSTTWAFGEPGVIQLGIQHKDTHACDVHKLTPVASQMESGPTTLGGFYKALSDTYDSMANLRFAGAYGYELITTGATANRYAVLDPSASVDDMPFENCTLAFSDPSEDLIKAVRDMMFRTAIQAANASDTQHVTAYETTTVSINESRFLYLGLATLATGLGWLAIFPTFMGWWHVGRKVSMSPVETAKAFGAPMLRSADSNADAYSLLKEIGDRPVRYGAAAAPGGQLDTLVMSEPRFVRTPHRRQTFVG